MNFCNLFNINDKDTRKISFAVVIASSLLALNIFHVVFTSFSSVSITNFELCTLFSLWHLFRSFSKYSYPKNIARSSRIDISSIKFETCRSATLLKQTFLRRRFLCLFQHCFEIVTLTNRCQCLLAFEGLYSKSTIKKLRQTAKFFQNNTICQWCISEVCNVNFE